MACPESTRADAEPAPGWPHVELLVQLRRETQDILPTCRAVAHKLSAAPPVFLQQAALTRSQTLGSLLNILIRSTTAVCYDYAFTESDSD